MTGIATAPPRPDANLRLCALVVTQPAEDAHSCTVTKRLSGKDRVLTSYLVRLRPSELSRLERTCCLAWKEQFSALQQQRSSCQLARRGARKCSGTRALQVSDGAPEPE